MRDAIAQERDFSVYNTEKRSQMCEIHLYEAALQVGNAYFYRLTEIKELSGSLWWMHEGRNLLKPVAGCGLFDHVELTGVVRH